MKLFGEFGNYVVGFMSKKARGSVQAGKGCNFGLSISKARA